MANNKLFIFSLFSICSFVGDINGCSALTFSSIWDIAVISCFLSSAYTINVFSLY